jgi:ubiquitin-conjugating enzyme E2 D/E
MEEIFFNSEDLQRIGAVKAFFSAFADRTMAYNLKHVISLVFFDDKYELKCSFTEVFAQFKDLVNRAKPRGMTALYDALMKAADSLVEIKQKYP